MIYVSEEPYLPHSASDHDHTAVSCPGYGQAFSTQLHGRGASFAPYIPEFASSVAAHRGQLCLLCRIPCHLLNSSEMAFQLRTIFHLRFFWIPYAQRAICRAGGYEVTRRTPSYGADAVERVTGCQVGLRELWTYV